METKDSRNKIIKIVQVLIFFLVLIKTAWISDDAYITFRSVENFIHGYGLVHNVGERVQTYTHPLWFFILAGLNGFLQKVLQLDYWSQMYYVTLFLSIIISLAALIIILRTQSRFPWKMGISIAVLIASRAFIDYSTSGLENSLSHLLIILYYVKYFGSDQSETKKIFQLSLLGCLLVLNRMDLFLLIIPSLTFLLLTKEKWLIKAMNMLAGFLPLIIWEFFSLFYYGTFFPNTAYAKLNTGLDKGLLLKQGINYFKNSLLLDPITLLVIAASLILILILQSKRKYPFLIGIGLYLLYIVYIGGDFMSGRFFSVVLLLSLLMILDELPRCEWQINAYLVSLITGYCVLFPNSPLRSPLDYGQHPIEHYIDSSGIADERGVYYTDLGLISPSKDRGFPGSRYSGKDWIYTSNKGNVVVLGPLGVEGYALGPNVHVIDKNGLSDPLMSRLSLGDSDNWRIGHFKHPIPEGYIDTLMTGSNQIINPNIAEYYEHIHLIVRGDLFSPERIYRIIQVSLGKYDYLLEE